MSTNTNNSKDTSSKHPLISNNNVGVASVTTTMCLAAIKYSGEIKKAIDLRRMHKYRAPAPEYGINISQVYKLADEGVKSDQFRKILFCVMIILLLVFWFDVASNPYSDSSPLVFFMWAGIVVSEFLFEKLSDNKLRRYVEDFDKQEVEVIKSSEEADPVIISGGYSPFVGSGKQVESWSFIIDLSKPEDDKMEVESLSVSELYEKLNLHLTKTLPHVASVFDQVFVHGKDASMINELLDNRNAVPNTKNRDLLEEKYLEKYAGILRKYVCVQIPVHDKRAMYSSYVRFQVQGKSLYVEGVPTLTGTAWE